MKDLIFITAHCPSTEQEEALERCVNSVLKVGYHVAVISHTHIPIHIQKKCNYYFYDHLNDITDDYNLIEHIFFKLGNKKIQSRFFQKTFYGFAIYRMFSIVSKIAINFGYEKIHHVEYDCEVLDGKVLIDHSRLLDTYDSVIYTTTGDESGFLFGSLKSFKVSSLPDLFVNYKRDKIEKELKLLRENVYLETLTKKIFIDSGNVFFMKESDCLKSFKKNSDDFYERNIHYTLFYDAGDNSINIFYKSRKESFENIFVIVNDSQVTKIEVDAGMWYIRSLGPIDNVKKIRIDNSEKIIYQKDFDDNFREIFKIKSYISNEEDN